MSLTNKSFRKYDDILDKLLALDCHCVSQEIKAELVIFGGAGLLLLLELQNKVFRPTRDIDVNLLSTNNQEALSNLLQEYGISIIGGVMEVPPIEDLREVGSKFKIEDVGFDALTVYVPTIELLACSKIFSKREKDLDDLKSSILENCDHKKLLELVTDYKDYVTYPEHPDLNLHEVMDILMEKVI